MPKVPQTHLDGRRDEILGAAHRCFARHGFHRTTMREIAIEAGLSAGALYRYFEGKEELLETLAGLGRRRTEVIESRASGSDASQVLEEAASKILAPLADPEMMDSLRLDLRLWAEALDGGVLRALIIRAFDDIRVPVAEQAGRGADRPAAGQPETIAAIFLSLILGAEVQKVFDTDFDTAAYCEEVRRIVAGMLRR